MSDKKNKRPYSPPKIRVIELDTKDVMATACKTQGYHSAMSGPHCGLVGSHGPCMGDGS